MNYTIVIGEFVGMFVLVFIILLSSEYIKNIHLRLFLNAFAFFIAINIAIYFSNAHINPIRSLVEYVYNIIKLEDFILYVIAQIMGGLFALFIFDTYIIKKRYIIKTYFTKK